MLKFFRKIRKSLIASGSARKYMLYAVGEILLVVIGILIALQLNNWNEWKKEREYEREVLEALAGNLEANIADLEQRIESIKASNQARDLVLEVLTFKKADTSLTALDWNLALVGGSRVALSQSGYENLKNTGFNILTNRELNREIVDFYENTFNNYENSLRWNDDFKADMDPFVREHFIGNRNNKGNAIPGLIPRDISVLLNNNYFYGLVDAANRQRGFNGFQTVQVLQEAQKLLELVESELNR